MIPLFRWLLWEYLVWTLNKAQSRDVSSSMFCCDVWKNMDLKKKYINTKMVSKKKITIFKYLSLQKKNPSKKRFMLKKKYYRVLISLFKLYKCVMYFTKQKQKKFTPFFWYSWRYDIKMDEIYVQCVNFNTYLLFFFLLFQIVSASRYIPLIIWRNYFRIFFVCQSF